MPLVVKDRVLENSTTTGTGTFTLSGAVTGYQTFSSAIGNGNTTYYTIANNAEWEVGIGTVGAGTLTRDTILESSNGGTAVNFSAGTKNVFCTYPAEKSVDIDTAQTLTNKTISVDNNTVSGIAASSFVLSNSSGNIDGSASQKAIPSGEVVGTTDTQTLSNKTLSSPSVTGSITFGDSSTQSTAATGFGFKNRIINGAMMIDQRNAGASVTPTNGQYTLDRWGAYAFGSATSKFTVQQSSTAPTGFKNSLQVTSTSAYSVASGDITAVYQIIEGYNVADLGFGAAGAATITISFWVRSSLTGTFGGAIKNGGSNRAYPFSYTISSANTWEQKSVTIAGDTTGTWLTTNGQGLFVMFGLGVGSTYSGTAGAWASSDLYSVTGATSVVGTNGATWFITGVQLEKGSTATSFDYRPCGTELALCQRYYEKTYNTDVAVATNTTVGRMAPSVSSDAGNNCSTYWIFAVEKRATPTITTYTTTGTSGSWNYERSGSSTTAAAQSESPGTRGTRIYISVGAAWVAVWIYGHAVASAEL